MAKIFLVGILFFSFVCSSLFAANGPREAWFFKRYLKNLERRSPRSYRARLTGSAITRRMNRIPPDARTKGRIPLVYIYNKKNIGQRIIVKNVDPAFRNMFALYNKHLNLTGAYLRKKGSTWKEFSRKYNVTLVRATAGYYQMRIAQRGSGRGSYGLFTIARSSLMIRSVRFYNRGSLVYLVNNQYRRYGYYYLPIRMIITAYQNGKRKKPVVIRFSQYKVNLFIPSKLFFGN